jgi:hypothetical protein
MNRPTVDPMHGAREFAWAVPRVGRSRGEIRDEFAKLVGEVEREWQAVFSRRLGYEIREQRQDDGSEVRLTVSRGDFVGHVELCCEPERALESAGPGRASEPAGALVIRMVASADSREVLAARAAGRRAIDRASLLTTSAGALLSLGFCWLTLRVELAPLVVGLMLLATIIGFLLVGGHALGVRVGEDLASRYQLRAERRLQHDLGLQADVKRWNSLGRQLRWHRRALARGVAGTPFRRG